MVVSGQQAGAATARPQSSVTALETALANSMLVLLNTERAANHKSALKMNTHLISSAHSHNLVMAKDNLMSHQCPGEAAPGTRITKAGYKWHSWGENIGWTTNETTAGIQAMEKEMYGEKAPNDGHRLNILGTFTDIGIDVYIDTVHHKLWYTQDFGYPL